MDAVPPRLLTLDAVRGVAVMGILLLNIVAFAMPAAAYFNPHAYGGAQGADLAVYLANFVLFDGKMRGLFSFLFGASMLLVVERAEARGEDPVMVHYSRMFWLLAFGLAHLWLVWWGDILSLYAPVGMIAFAFREAPVRLLVAGGVALIAMQVLVSAGLLVAIASAQADLPSPAAAATLAEFTRGFGVPPPETIATALETHRGPWTGLVAARWHDHALSPVYSLALFGWETLAYMLFGMAALRTGLLTGAWPRRRTLACMALGFAIGLPAYAALAAWLVAAKFGLYATVAATLVYVTPVRPFMILGWACLIVLLVRPGGALTARIAAAGRMAFTNYLATSLICTTLFYGHGLGWYGHLSRAELYLVVPCVWAAMLLWSKPWLDHFRFGPFEWLWRSLARGRLQPMRGPAQS